MTNICMQNVFEVEFNEFWHHILLDCNLKATVIIKQQVINTINSQITTISTIAAHGHNKGTPYFLELTRKG